MDLYSYYNKPESLNYFKEGMETVPEIFWNRLKHDRKEIDKRIPHFINSAPFAFNYATNVLNAKWPEGEAAIATDAHYSLLYARRFGRFKQGEKAILKDPELAAEYAIYVIGDPWPEGEDIIAKNPRYALWYASVLDLEKFPKAEKEIAKDAEIAYEYARSVLKGPFPEGEAAIAKESLTAYNYAIEILEKRFPAGEKAMREVFKQNYLMHLQHWDNGTDFKDALAHFKELEK